MDFLKIFYDDTYKNLFTIKTYKLKIEKLANNNISYKYEDKDVNDNFVKENKKQFFSDNAIKKILYKHFIDNYNIFYKYFKYHSNIFDRTCVDCIANNYAIKKQARMTTSNKNILLFNYFKTDNYNNKKYQTILSENSIFSKYGFYLFKTANNCNIYEVIDTNNDNIYNEKIVNDINKNTHHFITHNTNGNVYDKKTMNHVLAKLKDIKFDIILYDHGDEKYNLINNINAVLIDMYMMTRICDTDTNIFYMYYKGMDDGQKQEYLQRMILFKNLFNDIFLFKNIFRNVSSTLKLTKIDKKSKMYKDLKNIVNVVMSGKKTVVFDSKNHHYDDIDDFINTSDIMKKNKTDILYKILLISEKNYLIYKIIDENIKNAQIDVMHNKKYIKYLDPY